MRPKKPGRPPPEAKPPPGGRLKAENPKLADQARKRLGKHYASKYQTMRRG